jgi:hypothetical protein
VDLGDAAVFAIAEAADVGDDVESELMLGQCVVSLGFGPVGLAVAFTVAVVAASDVEGEAQESGEGGDGASVLVIGPQALVTGGAMGKPGLEVFGACGLGSCCRPGPSCLRG